MVEYEWKGLVYATLAFCCQVIEVHEIVRQVCIHILTVLAIFTLTSYNYMYTQYELYVGTCYTVVQFCPSVIYTQCT